MLHRADDVFGRILAGQHVGVRHARHGDVLVTLAASVAGVWQTHQFGREPVAEITLENSLFDQHRVVGGVAFVVDVERAAAAGQGAVVDYRALVAGHAAAEQAGKSGGLFAVEVGLKPVADGFVQQDAGPARTQHNFHFAGRALARIQLNDGLPRRFPGEVLRSLFSQKRFHAVASAASGGAASRGLARAGDDKHAHPRQRLHVFGKRAVGTDDENTAKLLDVAGAHFRDPRIVGAGRAVGAQDQLNFLCDRGIDGRRRIKVVSRMLLQIHHRNLGGTLRDQGSRARRVQNPLRRQVIGVGVAGALAGNDANAAARRNSLRSRFDHRFVKAQRGRRHVFEVEVGIVAACRKRRRQIALHVDRVEAVFLEEKPLVFIHIHSHIGWMPQLPCKTPEGRGNPTIIP